jgi:hypothetical protein
MTVPLKHRQNYVADVVNVAIEAQILENIVFAQAIPTGGAFVECSVSHDDVTAAFD